MRVRIAPEAEADLGEIYAWYSERSDELGLEFLAAFAQVLQQVEAFPRAAPEIDPGVRRILLRRFPYGVFYLVEPAEAVVLGCFHASRDPRAWRVRTGG